LKIHIMTSETSAAIQPGECIEFWARRRAQSPWYLRVQHPDGRTLYALESLGDHFEFFSYTNRSGDRVVLTARTEAIAFSYFYVYDRATVAELGVIFWEFVSGEVHRYSGTGLQTWMARDPTRPALHFTPFKNWINDPNGLCLVGDTYHLFYQFHPHSTDWGPMHWGHATSTDLYRWRHLPVFLHPEQNLERLGATGGAFSGTACTDGEGQVRFYYTERLPAYGLFKGYTEVQKLLQADSPLLKPVAIRTVLEGGAAGTGCDIRDPKVWWDKAAGAYRMILGSSIEGDPSVLLYGSPDGVSWSFIDVLYRAPAQFREHGARCIECPDFFPLEGHWVLTMGFVGYHEPDSGRHNLLYASVGSFQDDKFSSELPLQELDFGTDYYAMQSFSAKGRQLAMAWMFNWEFRKPVDSDFSGEMALPRVLSLDTQRRLCMNPDEGLYRWKSKRVLATSVDDVIRPEGQPFELQLGGRLTGLYIEGRDDQGHRFVLMEEDSSLLMFAPQDQGKISYRSRPVELTDVRLFFDRGILEVFANGGAVCGTRRSYDILNPCEVTIRTPRAHDIDQFSAHALVDE